MMMDWLENYLHSLGDLGALGVLVFVFSFAGLSMLGLPLIPFAVMGGILFGVAGGLTWVVAGSTLGAAAGFLVSRYVARERVAGLVSRSPKLILIDSAIHREGWKIIALLRMCPLPFGFSNYAYGLTKVPFWHYLGATALGILPAEIVSVCLGAAGRKIAEVQASPEAKVLAWIGAAALVAALVILRKIVRNKIPLAAEIRKSGQQRN
ncbi:MAG: VTT domain-containing protein [Verrucomicrobiae bacterium]